MLFLGTTFFSGSHTLDPPAVHVSPVTEIKLTNGTLIICMSVKTRRKPSKAPITNGTAILC